VQGYNGQVISASRATLLAFVFTFHGSTCAKTSESGPTNISTARVAEMRALSRVLPQFGLSIGDESFHLNGGTASLLFHAGGSGPSQFRFATFTGMDDQFLYYVVNGPEDNLFAFSKDDDVIVWEWVPASKKWFKHGSNAPVPLVIKTASSTTATPPTAPATPAGLAGEFAEIANFGDTELPIVIDVGVRLEWGAAANISTRGAAKGTYAFTITVTCENDAGEVIFKQVNHTTSDDGGGFGWPVYGELQPLKVGKYKLVERLTVQAPRDGTEYELHEMTTDFEIR
jgi:hypothetical protein